MVNAQSRSVPFLEGTKATVGNQTLFYDILTADTVKNLSEQTNRIYYFLLSVTGIANPTGLGQELSDTLNLGGSPVRSTDSTYVMYLDGSWDDNGEVARLRIENLARLDTSYHF